MVVTKLRETAHVEGKRTMFTTIPLEYAEKLNIKKGDALSVVAVDSKTFKVTTAVGDKAYSVLKNGASLVIHINKPLAQQLNVKAGDCFVAELRDNEIYYRVIE